MLFTNRLGTQSESLQYPKMDFETIESIDTEIARVNETIQYFKHRERLLENGIYKLIVNTRQNAEVTAALLRDVRKYSFRTLSMFNYLVNSGLPKEEVSEPLPAVDVKAVPEPTGPTISCTTETENPKSKAIVGRRLSVSEYIKSTQPRSTCIRLNPRTTAIGQAHQAARRLTVTNRVQQTRKLTVRPQTQAQFQTEQHTQATVQATAQAKEPVQALTLEPHQIQANNRIQHQQVQKRIAKVASETAPPRAILGGFAVPSTTRNPINPVKQEPKRRIRHNADYPKPWLDPPNAGTNPGKSSGSSRNRGPNEDSSSRASRRFTPKSSIVTNRNALPGASTQPRVASRSAPRAVPLPLHKAAPLPIQQAAARSMRRVTVMPARRATLIPSHNVNRRTLAADPHIHNRVLASDRCRRSSMFSTAQTPRTNKHYLQMKQPNLKQIPSQTVPSQPMQSYTRRRTAFRQDIHSIPAPKSLLSSTHTAQRSHTEQASQATTESRRLSLARPEMDSNSRIEAGSGRLTPPRPYPSCVIQQQISTRLGRTLQIKSPTDTLTSDIKPSQRQGNLNSIFIHNTLTHNICTHKVLSRIPKKL